MDASKNGFKPKCNHRIGNDKGVEKINRFGPMKPSVGNLFDCHKNKNSNENLQFKNNKSYPIHLSFGALFF
jgi:hypothetical protein